MTTIQYFYGSGDKIVSDMHPVPSNFLCLELIDTEVQYLTPRVTTLNYEMLSITLCVHSGMFLPLLYLSTCTDNI